MINILELSALNKVKTSFDTGIYNVLTIDYINNRLTIDRRGIEWRNVTDLFPIPTTEDLLRLLGFEEDESWYVLRFPFKPNNHRTVRNSISINLTDRRTTINSSEGVHEAIYINVAHCEHIHQIQNLYFSLKHEQLPINFK